ncbi:unnamed protein product, partial [Symbiodinium sp. CCMP2456]
RLLRPGGSEQITCNEGRRNSRGASARCRSALPPSVAGPHATARVLRPGRGRTRQNG